MITAAVKISVALAVKIIQRDVVGAITTRNLIVTRTAALQWKYHKSRAANEKSLDQTRRYNADVI